MGWCPEPAPTQCNAGGDIDVDEVCAAYCQGEYCYTSGGHAVQHGTSEQCWQCQCDNRSPEPMGDKFFTYVSLVSGCSSAYVDQDCVRRNNWQGCYCRANLWQCWIRRCRAPMVTAFSVEFLVAHTFGFCEFRIRACTGFAAFSSCLQRQPPGQGA